VQINKCASYQNKINKINKVFNQYSDGVKNCKRSKKEKEESDEYYKESRKRGDMLPSDYLQNSDSSS
jgi:hypothetical protein